MDLDPDIAVIASILNDKASGKKKTDFAKALKINNNAVSDMLAGKRQLKKTELVPAADFLGVVLPTQQLQPAARKVSNGSLGANSPVRVRRVPVRGQAAAGVWLQFEHFDEDRYPPVPFVEHKSGVTDQFAYRVVGNSVNREGIYDGDFVVCILVDGRPGDVVVVERRRGGLFERTCKMLVDVDGERRLESRSDDPRYNDDAIDIAVPEEGAEVEIVGVVIGSYRPRP